METEIKKKDIWLEGVRNIMAATKRSLLDYIDAIILQNAEFTKEKQQLEKVKMRVHNDISQASFNIGVLVSALRSGGDISAFEDDLNRKEKKLKIKEKIKEVEAIRKEEVVVEKIGEVLIESNASTDQKNNSN